MAKTPDFEKARNFAVSRLAEELSPMLIYHSLSHTVGEVVPAAERLATLENVGEEDRLLLLTAAFYHDLGYIYQRQGHEALSIQIAEQALPDFGYSEAQIAVVRNIIQATCVPQSPSNLREMIMADADLDYLGADDFWKRSNDLRYELENYDKKFTDAEWHTYQLSFIQHHQYFTAAERSLRDGKKLQHLVEIQTQLDKALEKKGE